MNVRLTDLNDFIAPGQVCVVAPKGPIKEPPINEGTSHPAGVSNSTSTYEVMREDDPRAQQALAELKPATISLNDCLACSGCITSAETVLVAMQSQEELYRVFRGVCSSTSSATSAASGMAVGSTTTPQVMDSTTGAVTPPISAIAISLSPQTRAAFAAKHRITLRGVVERLNTMFRALATPPGHDAPAVPVYLLDTSFSRDIALEATWREFRRRLGRLEVADNGKVSFSRGNNSSNDSSREIGSSRENNSSPTVALTRSSLPMLASSCPGWICYAEKTQGAPILPYISRARSPQQVMGWLVKEYGVVMAASMEEREVSARAATEEAARMDSSNRKASMSNSSTIPVHRSSIYHCTLMPCFDKKLEASREDFAIDGVRDVDCVLSSGEVELMVDTFVRERGYGSFAGIPCTAIGMEEGVFWNVDRVSGELMGTDGTASGGSVEYLSQRLAAELREHLPPKTSISITRTPGRNADILEYTITVSSSVNEDPTAAAAVTPIARLATAYGFRNIQNVVRRLKQKRSAFGRARDVAIAQERAGWEAYDYVEVMACPSGCINGGGQLKPSPRKVIVAQGDDANAMDVDEPEPATTTTTPASIENITAVKAFVAEMDAAYHSIPTRTPIDNHAAWRIVEHALGGWETPAAEQWLYTSYHDVSAVPSPAEANALTAKW